MDKLKDPITLTLESSKTYFFCTCGKSEKYPFCDGTHRTEAIGKKSFPYQCDVSKTVTYVDGTVKE